MYSYWPWSAAVMGVRAPGAPTPGFASAYRAHVMCTDFVNKMYLTWKPVKANDLDFN